MCQQNLSLEKASILFNMAALYSQIATRSDRQTIAGLQQAISSFQKAAGMKRDRCDQLVLLQQAFCKDDGNISGSRRIQSETFPFLLR